MRNARLTGETQTQFHSAGSLPEGAGQAAHDICTVVTIGMACFGLGDKTLAQVGSFEVRAWPAGEPGFASDVNVRAENTLSIGSALRINENAYRRLNEWAPESGPLSPMKQYVYWTDRYPSWN